MSHFGEDIFWYNLLCMCVYRHTIHISGYFHTHTSWQSTAVHRFLLCSMRLCRLKTNIYYFTGGFFGLHRCCSIDATKTFQVAQHMPKNPLTRTQVQSTCWVQEEVEEKTKDVVNDTDNLSGTRDNFITMMMMMMSDFCIWIKIWDKKSNWC